MKRNITSNVQNENSEVESSVSRFVQKFRMGKLLRACNAVKTKGISALALLVYLLSVVFKGRSMYQDMRREDFAEGFGKNTVYRFLSNPQINWERLQRMLAKIATDELKPLTVERRKAFVVDDSPLIRDRGKKVELLAKFFNHVDNCYHRGFRAMTLGWDDGNTFIPIRIAPLATSNKEMIVGPIQEFDKRTLAAKRRAQAQEKGTDVTVALIHEAQASGIEADIVLFDSWFNYPSMAKRLYHEEGLYVLGMVKKGPTKYVVTMEDGSKKEMNVKQIFRSSKKRRGRSRYLLSCEVMLGSGKDAIPARLVFVRNRNNRKDWLVLMTTDMTLTEEEIIQLYGRRWDIEVFFKFCKQCLRLDSECHALSYDAMCAHLTIVMARYVMLALEQRANTDCRTMGELFLAVVDELPDISLVEALSRLLTLLLDYAQTDDKLTAEKIDELLSKFIETLPQRLKHTFRAVRKRVA